MVTLTQTTTVRPSTTTTKSSKTYSPKDRLLLSIDSTWYDLTSWQHIHPGGSRILQHLNGADATDAFYSLHSQEARERLTRLPKIKSEQVVDTSVIPPSSATLAFRQLRQQLESDGWFKKSVFWEFFYQSNVYLLAILGSYFAFSATCDSALLYNCLAVLCIGISMQQCGWVGHDTTHSRGNFALYSGRLLSWLVNAFSPKWWSEKHNTHHVYTNHVGIDVDIQNDPVIHLLFPEPSKDVWFRTIQHLYYFPVCSILFISWRVQSLQFALMNARVLELIGMTINYTWLYLLGWKISLLAVLLSGFLVALVVTASHQSEDMYENEPEPLNKYSFVECQFATTRDVETNNPLMSWMWGGMQYQLEHHLFPTLPRYYYPSLTKIIKKFAAENRLDYRCDTVGQILKRNFQTIKKFAGKPEEQWKKQN